MLDVQHLGTLRLAVPSQPGRPAHLAAASGLVHRGSQLVVVADDEPILAFFEAEDPESGRIERLADEELPLDHDERKAAKPDLEALAELPDGNLLTIGSGATERRERGWIWADGSAREVSLSALYRELRPQVPELNIEGAAIAGDRLWLAQRGNGAEGENMLVALDLDRALAELRAGELTADGIAGTTVYELGEVRGVPLTFSDLAPLPDGRLLFCAVAEDSASTYHDGECVAAGLGMLDLDSHEVTAFELLPEPHKIEGVSPAPRGGVLLVADADDVEQPAPLLRASLPG